VVLIEALASEGLIGKNRDLVRISCHGLEKCLHVALGSRPRRRRRRGAHGIFDQAANVAFRVQTVSLDLRGELIGDINRDLHEESVAGPMEKGHNLPSSGLHPFKSIAALRLIRRRQSRPGPVC